MEKFELLLTVLKALKDAGALNHLTLVGSWCLDVYRNIFPENTSIPATRTMDADILIPRRFPRGIKIDVPIILEEIGFITHVDYPSGFHRFVHPELNLEFLTHAGAKSSLSVHDFKQLGLTVQELRYMNIPLQYSMRVVVEGLEINVPEPEAFALHKLIVTTLRNDDAKSSRDLEAAAGLLRFFEDRPMHVRRLCEIYTDFPKGWKQRVNAGMVRLPRDARIDLA